MFRLRRYRYYVFFAAILVFLLYRVSQNSAEWEEVLSSSFPASKIPARKNVESSTNGFANQDGDLPQKILDNTGKGKTQYSESAAQDSIAESPSAPKVKVDTPEKQLPPAEKFKSKVSPDNDRDAASDPSVQKKPALSYDKEEAAKVNDVPSIQLPNKDHGKGATSTSTTTGKGVHWEKPKENFPVPEDEIIALPSGKPLKIPQIQYPFAKESADSKERREARLDKVKAEMKRSWDGYMKYAKGHDELRPVSKTNRDPFCGWAATLVDSLDTLWIMGMKDEFEEALVEVEKIDFTTASRTEIPVFETTIRYLGGLVAAYDVSGGEEAGYDILLKKAVELAEILMGVFDTPNRMPVLYYNWRPSSTSRPKRAGTSVSVAELGSLAMEFTRLAQLTKENKYYDAVARITDAFYEWQERGTAVEGIFPEHIDASGCNTTAQRELEEAQRQNDESNLPKRAVLPVDEQKSAKTTAPEPPLPECVSQGLTPSSWGHQQYGMGGSQDSTYEYFPKQWLLLGGLEPKYKELHRQVSQAVKKWLLYRPMVPDERDMLFSGKLTTRGHPEKDAMMQYEVTHLTCFIGGMFGLGGRIFDVPADVETAKKLTEGCVWAYESTNTGIMPELATVMPCGDVEDCHWNQTKYWQELDPGYAKRDDEIEAYYDRKQKLKAQKQEQLEEKKRQEEEARLHKESKNKLYSDSANEKSDAQDEDAEDFSSLRKRAPTYIDDEDERSGVAIDYQGKKTSSKQTPLVADEDDEDDELTPDPYKPLTHEQFVKKKIADSKLPPGFTAVGSRSYILRPEAIESVWYMYRITGDEEWQEKGWNMFKSIVKYTSTEVGNSAIDNVLTTSPVQNNEMESFWTAETLKYFYLLYSEPSLISLDDWVLNTEAHPFKRPTSSFGV